MNIFFQQIGILAILVVIGAGARHFNVVSPAAKDGLAKIIFNITLPLLIFTGIPGMEMTRSLATNSLVVLFFSFLVLGIMWAIGTMSSRALGLPPNMSPVHIVHTMFGNIVYLGFPLINELFPGGEGLYYAMLFHLSSSLIMWTLGVYLLNTANGFFHGLKNLLNPNTFAFILGFFFLVLQIPLPEFLAVSLGGLGDTTIFLSMLYIGFMLADISWKSAITSLQGYVLSFNKLLTIPFAALLLALGPMEWLSMHPGNLAYSVIILESAMPCMANIVVLAKIFGANDDMATQNVFISTIISIFTLPLVYFALKHFFPINC